jgi:hypothetical protein
MEPRSGSTLFRHTTSFKDLLYRVGLYHARQITLTHFRRVDLNIVIRSLARKKLDDALNEEDITMIEVTAKRCIRFSRACQF